jgi:ribosomal protein S18 acetylase RimI-like enzyme
MLQAEKAPELDIEYRLARPDESEAISELLLESFGLFEAEYTPGAFEYTTPNTEVVRGRFEEGPVWVAMDGNTMIGTVSGLPEPGRFYVRSMAVSPDAQGHGIGQHLLEVLEAFARDKGFERTYLYTTHVLPGAKRLYEKNGFYVLRETPAEEWYDMAGLEMEKKLEKPVAVS